MASYARTHTSANKLSLPAGMAAFVIGLQRTAAWRGAPTQKAWKEAGLPMQWWEGVDGAQVLRLRPGEKSSSPFWGYSLFANQQRAEASLESCQMGNYLSQYRLWQHCLTQGYRRVFIVEDDAVPKPDLHEIWNALLELDDSFELVKLNHETLPPHLLEYPTLNYPTRADYALRRFAYSAGEIQLHRPYQDTYSSSAYLCTRKALLKMVKHAMPAAMPTDIYMDRFSLHGVRVYLTLNSLVQTDSKTSMFRPKPNRKPRGKKKSRVRALLESIRNRLSRKFDQLLRLLVMLKSPRGEFHPRQRIPPHFFPYFFPHFFRRLYSRLSKILRIG